jgi:hypothetical protein
MLVNEVSEGGLGVVFVVYLCTLGGVSVHPINPDLLL